MKNKMTSHKSRNVTALKKDAGKGPSLQPRLRALMESLFSQKRQIDEIQKQVNTLETSTHLRPSLFSKLKNLLAQIAGLKEKEEGILSEIGAVEKRHAMMRKANKLKKASPKLERNELREEEKRRLKYARGGFWTNVMVGMLLANLLRKKNNKKPDIT